MLVLLVIPFTIIANASHIIYSGVCGHTLSNLIRLNHSKREVPFENSPISRTLIIVYHTKLWSKMKNYQNFPHFTNNCFS